MSTIPTIELNDGTRIPQLGFGVFQIEPDKTAQSVQTALEIGYRHIDTAEMYQNEAGVGQGIRDAGLDRAEVYITSKLNNGYHEPDDARRAFDATLEKLGFDYVDLFLIHWPLPTLYDGDFVSTWRTLEEFKKDGAPAASGCPTSRSPTCSGWRAKPTTTPAVNQIEVHPYFTNDSRARLRRRARDRHRGLVADRPGAGARRPGRQANRRGYRPDTGSGGAALAHPARRHRVPEIGDSATHQGELRIVRLRARRCRHERDVVAGQGRGRPHRPQPRQCSTTSLTEPRRVSRSIADTAARSQDLVVESRSDRRPCRRADAHARSKAARPRGQCAWASASRPACRDASRAPWRWRSSARAGDRWPDR